MLNGVNEVDAGRADEVLPEFTGEPPKVKLDASAAAIEKATRSRDPAIQNLRLNQVINTLWMPFDMDAEIRSAMIHDAFDTLYELDPQDAFERMLVAQMVACHNAAMECFRRAMTEGVLFSVQNMAFKNGQRLMATYAKHGETLNKHRGKGQQKVTVEHVNVHAGGQAVVGNVEMANKAPASTTVPALERSQEVPMDAVAAKPKTKVGR